jgi:hypothetical protein
MALGTLHVIASEQHPSLLYSSQDIGELRDRVKDNPRSPYLEWYEDIEVFYDPDGDYDWGWLGPFVYMLEEEDLIADVVAHDAKEYLKDFRNFPPTSGYLYSGSFGLQHYCEAYDMLNTWLVDNGLDEDRTKIRNAIAASAEYFWRELEKPRPAGGRHYGNQRLLAASALGTAAHTLRDYGRASIWRGKAGTELSRIENFHFWQSDGMFIEGNGYLCYTSANLMPFMWHHFRFNQFNYFAKERIKNTYIYLAYMRTPDGNLVNFGTSPMYWHSRQAGMFHPLLVNNSVGVAQGLHQRLFQDGSNKLTYPYHNSHAICFYDENVSDDVTGYPPTGFFPVSEEGVFRNEWSPEATCMWFKGKPNNWTSKQYGNYSHGDVGQFVIYAYDGLFAVDNGYDHTWPGEDDTDCEDDHRSSLQHNVLLVDGKGPDCLNTRGDLQNYYSTEFLDAAEISTHYRGISLVRTFLFPGKEYFIIIDDVNSGSNHNYKWRWHTAVPQSNASEIDIDPGQDVVTYPNWKWEHGDAHGQGVAVGQGAADMDVIFGSPVDGPHTVLDETSIWYPSGAVDKLTGHHRDYPICGIEAVKNAASTRFLVALFPYERSGIPPVLTRLNVTDADGIKIEQDDFVDVVITKDGNGIVTYEDKESDGETMLTREVSWGLDHFMIQHGSYLKHDGNYVMHVSSGDKITLAMKRFETKWEGYVIGDDYYKLRLYLLEQPTEVYYRGTPPLFQWDSQHKYCEIELAGEGKLEVTTRTLYAPTNLIAEPRENCEMFLSWQDNSTINTGYKVEWGTSSLFQYSETVPNDPGHEHPIQQNLVAGQEHQFQVTVICPTLESNPSNITCATPLWCYAPTELMADAISYDKVVLTWKDKSRVNNGCTPGWRAEWVKGANFSGGYDGSVEFADNNEVDDTDQRTIEWAFEQGEKYTFRVQAKDGAGHPSDWSNEAWDYAIPIWSNDENALVHNGGQKVAVVPEGAPDAGTICVVWSKEGEAMYTETSDAGNTWSREGPIGECSLPAIAISSQGVRGIVFEGPEHHVLYRHSNDGKHWSYPWTIIADNQGISIHPSISIDFQGNAHVVWLAENSGTYYIRYSYFACDNPPESPTVWDIRSSSNPCEHLSIGIEFHGKENYEVPSVLWQEDKDANKTAIWFSQDTDGNWPPEEVSGIAPKSFYPSIVGYKYGIFGTWVRDRIFDIVFWHKGSDLQSVFSPAEPPFTYYPVAAVAWPGVFYVCWMDCLDGDIYLSTNSGSDQWCPRVNLSNSPDKSSEYPHIALSSDETQLHAFWVEEVISPDLYEIKFDKILLSPEVTLIQPNGNQKLEIGEGYEVKWNTTDHIATQILEYTVDDGVSWNPIPGSLTPDDRSHIWNVPQILSDECRVRITVTNELENIVQDESDANFSILWLGSDLANATASNNQRKVQIDSRGHVHVLWNDEEHRSSGTNGVIVPIVRYAKSDNMGDSWMEKQKWDGKYGALDLDNTDNPVICCIRREGNKDILYYYCLDMSCTLFEFESGMTEIGIASPTMMVKDDKVHIVLHTVKKEGPEYYRHKIRYSDAFDVGGPPPYDWEVVHEWIASTSHIPTSPCIDVDCQLRPHIVYTKARDGQNYIYYANKFTGGWQLEEVYLGTSPCAEIQGNHLHLVWEDPDAEIRHMWGAIGSSEVGWLSSPTNISESPDHSSRYPTIIEHNHVLWSEEVSPGLSQIYCNHFYFHKKHDVFKWRVPGDINGVNSGVNEMFPQSCLGQILFGEDATYGERHYVFTTGEEDGKYEVKHVIDTVLVSHLIAVMSGPVADDTTWESSTVVVVTGDLTIEPSATLVIEPGVTLLIAKEDWELDGIDTSRIEIFVRGTLIARGEIAGGDTGRIGFVSMDTLAGPGDWYGIRFESASVGSLIYCDIEYAEKGVAVQDGQVAISNSEIKNNKIGIEASGGAISAKWNKIVDNDSIGVIAHVTDLCPRLRDLL